MKIEIKEARDESYDANSRSDPFKLATEPS
jgi:hypothetical protein